MKFPFKEGSYYIDGYLKSNLDLLIRDVKDDNDCVIAVSGREGTGKSTMTIQAACYVDPTFNLDRVVFDSADFRKRVLAANKYEAVVFDECIAGLRGVSWSGHVSRALVQMLAQIRQKNLFVFLVLPSFFELIKYAAIHRTQALLHCYRGKDGKRGRFVGYGWEKKKRLYLMGKKFYDMNVQHGDFVARFTKAMPLDDAAYRKKKLLALEKAQVEPETRTYIKTSSQRDGLIKYLIKDKGESATTISKGMRKYCPDFALSDRQIRGIGVGERGVNSHMYPTDPGKGTYHV